MEAAAVTLSRSFPCSTLPPLLPAPPPQPLAPPESDLSLTESGPCLRTCGAGLAGGPQVKLVERGGAWHSLGGRLEPSLLPGSADRCLLPGSGWGGAVFRQNSCLPNWAGPGRGTSTTVTFACSVSSSPCRNGCRLEGWTRLTRIHGELGRTGEGCRGLGGQDRVGSPRVCSNSAVPGMVRFAATTH